MLARCCSNANPPRVYDPATNEWTGPGYVCCTSPVTDRIANSGTHGCRVMCEAHWLEYNANLAKTAGVPLTVENVLPLAIGVAERWADGALGYGEDAGDDVRAHTATLFAK